MWTARLQNSRGGGYSSINSMASEGLACWGGGGGGGGRGLTGEASEI